ncbi:MAG: rhodanese-like domain-containing protein [Lewinellaceae bacterium]|mgnify:FL=1|nr:rhodanese-like domain-containing protein [Lewinellaceae bacterium]
MKQEQLSHATVIDVREPFEFFFGHVKGSINIPLGSLTGRLDELKQMKKPLVFICASGNRSGQAVAFLQNQGWKDVYNGGGWREYQQRVAA